MIESLCGRFRRAEDPPVAKVLIALTVCAVLSVWFAPHLFTDKPDTDARTVVLQLAGGVIVLLGSYFAARTLKQSREDQLALRLIRAVEVLKTDSPSQQLAAVYVLAQLGTTRGVDPLAIKAILNERMSEDGITGQASTVAQGLSASLANDPRDKIGTATLGWSGDLPTG